MKKVKLSLLLLTAVFALQSFSATAMFNGVFSRFAARVKSAFKIENVLTAGFTASGFSLMSYGLFGLPRRHNQDDFLNAAKAGELHDVARLSTAFGVSATGTRDIYGNNALHLAAKHNNLDVAKYLDKKYPSMRHSTNVLDRLPLHVAGIHCNGKMYDLLREPQDKSKSPQKFVCTTAEVLDSLDKRGCHYLEQCPKEK